MIPRIEQSDILREMLDQGFMARPDDAHQFWRAYHAAIVGAQTALGLEGGLSWVAVEHVEQASVAGEGLLGAELAVLLARVQAEMVGDSVVHGFDPRRHSYCTMLVRVAVN